MLTASGDLTRSASLPVRPAAATHRACAARSGRRGLRLLPLSTLVLASLLLLALAPSAHAEQRALLKRFGTPSGSAAGQFNGAREIAVNESGNGGATAGDFYVIDFANARVQQFSAAGDFIRAFGKEVDASTGGNICEAASGDTCKAGILSTEAGALNSARGIAVDQSTGAVYVSDRNSGRIDVFSATGAFEGAFGWNVDSSAPAEELQFCTTGSGCKAGVPGAAAGQLSSAGLAGIAVDPRDGDLYVADSSNHRLDEYGITTSGGEVTGATFVRALGWKVDAAAPAEEQQQCTTLTGCLVGTTGAGAGQFSKEENPRVVAVDSNGYVYTLNMKNARSCSTTEPCQVLKFTPAGTFKEAFGPETGECQVNYNAGTAQSEEAFDVAVDPADDDVLISKKVGASEYRVFEFDEDGGSCQISPAGPPLTGTNVSGGLAVGTESQVYTDLSTEVFILGQAPPPIAEFGEVNGVSATEATFTGTVTPPAEVEGGRFDTRWRFEYSTDQVAWTPAPVPDGDAGSEPGVPVPVQTTVAGLAPSGHYFVRLCASTGPTVCDPSPPAAFTTGAAPPTLYESYAEGVEQTSAILAARLNPNNQSTSYYFEWGPTSAYGFRTPSASAGGGEPIHVSASLADLSPATTYHFRVVASNGNGTTPGPDETFFTLNPLGFPDNRVPELVSPAEKGPLGIVFEKLGINTAQPRLQVAPDGSAATYVMGYGTPDATTGGEVIYRSTRTATGWSSGQISPPLTGESAESFNVPGQVVYLSSDLHCGFVSTPSPLTPDTPERNRQEAEQVANLYRENPDGSFTLVTNRSPEALGGAPGAFKIVGASPNCSRVVFETSNLYEGVNVGSPVELYEWDEAGSPRLRHVGFVPGAVSEEAVPAAAGNTGSALHNVWNAVSLDGSRVIFTATSRAGADQGKKAVFVREDGQATTDISQSPVGSVDTGATYQDASRDGSRVFFTANAGLTTQSGAAGTDLYEYDAERPASERLLDLTADENPSDTAGAGVAGVVAASDSADNVYFLATGQLIAGAGRSQAKNVASGSFNLYLSASGHLSQVAVIEGPEAERLLISNSGRGEELKAWLARVTPDGLHLLFESSADITGYESGGVSEAYLYTAETPGNPSTLFCVSCRRDGKPSLGSGETLPLATGSGALNVDFLHPPRNLSVDGSRVFFEMPDVLAPGAVEGADNIYEWEMGQISLLAVEDQMAKLGQLPRLVFAGSSESGGDAFLVTSQRLALQDGDGRRDIYDLRVGGGFPLAQPQAPCNALVEGACQSPSTAAPPSMSPATPGSNGPGNAVPAKKHKPRKHKKKHSRHHHEKRHHRPKHRNGKKSHRRASGDHRNSNRGGRK